LVKIISVSADAEESEDPRLVLYCAVLKGKRFEWALEKAVELGAHRIVPLLCEHGVITPREGKQTRWLALMKSAVKQCGRSWLPELAPAQALPEALPEALREDSSCAPNTVRYFGAAPYELPAGQIPFWPSMLDLPKGRPPAELAFFVGW